MERRATGSGGIPVQRVEMTARDMDVIAGLINRPSQSWCCGSGVPAYQQTSRP